MVARSLVLAIAVMTAAGSVASADEQEDDEHALARQIAGATVRQARRAIALGPTAGLFAAYAPSPEDFDGGLSFGLEGQLFKTLVLRPGDLQELVRRKTRAKLARIVAERFAGVEPDAATMRGLVRDVLDEVKEELLDELGAKPRTLERPALHVSLEASYLFSSKDWITSLGFGFGIGPVSLGPSFSVHFGDQTVARLGAELSIHLLPAKSLRSPVFDVLVRGDFELHERDSSDDQLVFGMRVLLDVI